MSSDVMERKLLDAADGAIPVSCLLTSASLHDSQVAIPLATLTAERVRNLYDLMDSAYDAPGNPRTAAPWVMLRSSRQLERRAQAGAAAGEAGTACLWVGPV